MSKKYSNFRSIKRSIIPAIISTILTFTNTAFANNKKNFPKHFSAQYHMKQVENCVSEYELKRYIENLSDDELKNLYVKILQTMHTKPFDKKWLNTRLLISKTQTARAHAKIMRQSTKISPKKPIVLPKSSPLPPIPSPLSPIESEIPDTISPNAPKEEPLPSYQSAPPQKYNQPKRPAAKSKPAQVKMHNCTCCKQRRPIPEKNVMFECENCRRKNMKYICEKCLEERCAKALVGKLRRHRHCHFCKS